MRSFIVCDILALIMGALGQVLDYETTPFSLPPTSFSCQGRPPGYYADLETGCRTYHVCDGNSHFTYICPVRTLFQQKSRICDHSYLVRCEDAPAFFEDIYPEDDEILRRLAESEDNTENVDVSTQTEEFFTSETVEPVEISTGLKTTVTTEKPTTVEFKENATSVDHSSETNKTLKFVIKDMRSLFYIPEVDNNSIGFQAEREFVLLVDRKNLRFRNGKKQRHNFSACPSFCDPKFFLPGTCHPCIVIK